MAKAAPYDRPFFLLQKLTNPSIAHTFIASGSYYQSQKEVSMRLPFEKSQKTSAKEQNSRLACMAIININRPGRTWPRSE
ncbi:hypothetical protein [Aestuariispira insulae]|uniref:hypothetical protein n=1 Tax=Aestuariispira insulae TaxID=1461337 RepID=UPI0015F28BE5|nr:hypothetical protein [Aestuariispira insulae]